MGAWAVQDIYLWVRSMEMPLIWIAISYQAQHLGNALRSVCITNTMDDSTLSKSRSKSVESIYLQISDIKLGAARV